MSTHALEFSPRRVGAMVYRYVSLLRRDWTRLIEIVYWPTVQMILWGFISRFYATNSSWVAQAAGMLIAGVLLWDVLFRGQLGLTLSFTEEMYARNLGHLFISPLRPYELVLAMMSMSLIRTCISFGGSALLAWPLYAFNIFTLGLPLLVFFASLLVMSWGVGLLIVCMILRFGLGAESLAWAAILALAPVSGIYYPVSSLPGWLQQVAWFLPSSHVFEGMRAVMIQGEFRTDLLLTSLALNAVYIGVGIALFLWTFQIARRRGLLLNVGE